MRTDTAATIGLAGALGSTIRQCIGSIPLGCFSNGQSRLVIVIRGQALVLAIGIATDTKQGRGG